MAPLKSTTYSVLFALRKNENKSNLSSSKPSKEILFIEFWEEVRLPIATHQESFFKKSKIGAYKKFSSDKILLEKAHKILMSYHKDIKEESRKDFKKISKKKKISTALKSIQKSFTKAIKRIGRITERNYEPWEVSDLLEDIVMDISDMIEALKDLDKTNNPKA